EKFGGGTLCNCRWGEAPDEPAREYARPTKLYHQKIRSALLLARGMLGFRPDEQCHSQRRGPAAHRFYLDAFPWHRRRHAGSREVGAHSDRTRTHLLLDG